MALFPEREPNLPINERAEEFKPGEIPPEIERAGVTPRQTQFKAQVTDDSGKPLIQTPATAATIQIPADTTTLTNLSKGSTDDSITWWGAYWLRMIKKALHFGWKIITGRR